MSFHRRKTTKKATRKIVHKTHARDEKRKKRVRKKTHSDSAILRRKQKRQLQAAFKTIREYQSEASVRQPHPHVAHMQLEPNNFSDRVPPTNPQFDFQPPDGAMVRERRAWHEPHPEAFSPRGLKNNRRRKSHLDDVYGPNFEEFKEREYRKARYTKWDQPGPRSSTLRSIKRAPLKKFEYSNRSERDISSRSAVASDIEKQCISSTDNDKNKTNSNDGCDSKKRSSDIPGKSNSTNNTNVSTKASNNKILEDKVKKTPETETHKHHLNLEEIKHNTVKTAEVLDQYPEKVSNKIPHVKHTNIGHNSKNNSLDSFEKLVSCEKDRESDEETVLCEDFISIDKIDTTKSFLECFPADDYRVVDMEVDCPTPEQKSKTGSPNNLTETLCENVYSEINCDQLLNELNEAIEDNSKDVINNVDKGKTVEKTECKIKPCSKTSSDMRLKDAKSSKEYTRRILKKPCSDKKNNVERRKSTNNKMSSVFYPGLANYTIPKKVCEKKSRFSDIDEPYMNKMQSLFGIEEDNDNDQVPTESMDDNKCDSKKNNKKRLSTDEVCSQNKKRCTDTKTSKSSRGSVERHTKRSSKLVEEKSKSNKNWKRIADTVKTSKSTNTIRSNANESRRNKTNQDHESTESIRLSKESTDSKKQREPLTKTVRKSEANNAKQTTEKNAVDKKSCREHLKVMDYKRRNSETPSSNTKLITKRRHSLQLNSSADIRQNEKLLENLQTKNVSKEISSENDIVKLLEEHSEKSNVQVKHIGETNNSKDQIEKVIAEHSAVSFSEESLPSKDSTAAKSPLTLDNNTNQMKSKTDLDEISSALSKIFESETPLVESAPEPTMSSDKESPSEVTPKEICSVMKHLQEQLIEGKANNTSHFRPKNTDFKSTHDIATTSDILPSKPLEKDETSTKYSNMDADLCSKTPADEIGKPTESLGKMPSDIAGTLVAPCQQPTVSEPNNDEDTNVEKPTEKVQDESSDIDHQPDHKPILDSNDDKNKLSVLKVPPLVKNAVKGEFFLTTENCTPLSGISLPQFDQVHICTVLSDCSDKATIMESPDVNQSLGLIRNEKCVTVEESKEIVEEISDNDDPFDDVIEIRPNIPVIDLTKESSDVNTTKVDSKEDLLGLLEEGFDKREKITIYRSDETSNNSLEVQAMSASIAPINILRTNTPDIDEPIVPVAKVEPDVAMEPCGVIESNQNTDSTGETVSLTFANNVRNLISQLEEDSESQTGVSVEIPQNEETATQKESTEIVERPVVRVQPAVENFRPESISPDNSNDVSFIHPESVDKTAKKTKKKTNPRRNSQPNILAPNDIQTSPLHETNQTVGQKENDLNHISQLTRFVFPEGLQEQENRLNETQLMETVMNEETNQMTQPSLELAFGNRSLINSIQQSPCRADINSNPSIYDFQNAGTVQDNSVACHLTQQEYLVINTIVPYIHLMSCIRRNQADHAESLKKNLFFLPELLKIELKLAEHIYMNKLQIYSGYIVNRLKLMDLSRNMTSVTAHATIELIFQTVRNVNYKFTKTCTILFLEHLMKPHETFYGNVPYLKSFHGLVKVFCREIVRRAAVSSDVPPSQQLTPDQRKTLEYQILEWHKILYTEKCKQQRIERLNGENNNRPVTTEGTLFSLLNSRPAQANASKNPVAARTSASKSCSANEGHTSAVTNSPAHLTAAFRSPAHRPEGFMNSPAHSFNESNVIPMNGVDFNYSTLRSPAHRSEGILPQARSQRNSNNAIFTPGPGAFRSPAHRPEDRQLPANLRSPAYSTMTNNSIARMSEMLRSPAHIPEGIRHPAPSSIVCGQNKTNNAALMAAATMRSPFHRPPPPLYSVHSNRNQQSNSSLNALQCLAQTIPDQVPEAVLRSPAHRPESFSSSPGHFPVAWGSPAHRFDRPMNSPVRSSAVQKSPVHQPGSQHKFVVPRKPPNKPKNVNSPPVSALIHTSPSRSVGQNSPVPVHFANMSPDQTSSNEVSPRTSNVAFGSRNSPAAATPSRGAMPNLINIRSPVYAPMLFSPPNFLQDEPDDSLDADEGGSQNNCGKDSGNEENLETIDLTWLDDVDEEQIQKDVDFVIVKKEEPDDGEVILNQEQFPVVPSPADSGIASPSHQEECSELVYLHRLCICEGPAEYLCKCRMVMYCSTSCQARDWKDHKMFCNKYTIKNKDNK